MSYTRNTTLKGPAILKLGTATMRSQGDINCELSAETYEIQSSEKGRIDERIAQARIRLTFTPVGSVDAAMLAALFPHLGKVAGQSLIGATDTPLTITPLTGKGELKLVNAVVTKMPDIILSAQKTAFGEVEITGLLANGAEWSAAAARYVYAPSVATPTPGDFDLSAIPTLGCEINWGAAPFNKISSKEGVTVSFELQTQEETTDIDGVVDLWFSGLQTAATFEPLGLTDEQILNRLKIQGAGARRGASLATGADDLILTTAAGGLKVTLPKAYLKEAPLRYGRETSRVGQIQLIAGLGATPTVSILPPAVGG